MNKLELVCFRLKPWRPPKPGQIIGPQYRFEKKTHKTLLIVDAPRLGPGKFDIDFSQQDIFPSHTISIFKEGSFDLRAFLSWDQPSRRLDEIDIRDPELHGSGLSCVIMNIMLRNLLAHHGVLASFCSTKTAEFDHSTLAVIGLFEKFGLDCYRRQDLQAVLSTFWDGQNPLYVKTVKGHPDLYYFQYIPTSWRAWSNATFKIFLPQHQQDKGLHERLANDREQLKRLILSGEAYLTLPPQIDPQKIPIMEEYAAALPENPF